MILNFIIITTALMVEVHLQLLDIVALSQFCTNKLGATGLQLVSISILSCKSKELIFARL